MTSRRPSSGLAQRRGAQRRGARVQIDQVFLDEPLLLRCQLAFFDRTIPLRRRLACRWFFGCCHSCLRLPRACRCHRPGGSRERRITGCCGCLGVHSLGNMLPWASLPRLLAPSRGDRLWVACADLRLKTSATMAASRQFVILIAEVCGGYLCPVVLDEWLFSASACAFTHTAADCQMRRSGTTGLWLPCQSACVCLGDAEPQCRGALVAPQVESDFQSIFLPPGKRA